MIARKGKRLPFQRLLALGRAVAAAHSLSMPSVQRLRLRHSERVPIPSVTTNGHGTLWIDRDYIAYALVDEIVRYVYVTRTHAKEEIASYATLRKLRSAEAAVRNSEPIQDSPAHDELERRAFLSIQGGRRPDAGVGHGKKSSEKSASGVK